MEGCVLMQLFYMEKTIHSPLSTEQVVKKLRGATGLLVATLGKPFVGTVSKDSFTLRSFSTGINTPSPRLYGQLTATDKGTQIHVVAKPRARAFHIALMFVLVFLFLFVFVEGLLGILDGRGTESEWMNTILSLPFGALMVTVMHLAFWIPAKNAVYRLEQLVK